MTMQQEMRAGYIAFTSGSRNENVQVNGFVFLFDMTGFGTKQLSRFSTSEMRKWHSFWGEVSLCYTLYHKKTSPIGLFRL